MKGVTHVLTASPYPRVPMTTSPATPNQTPLTVKLRRPGGRFLVGSAVRDPQEGWLVALARGGAVRAGRCRGGRPVRCLGVADSKRGPPLGPCDAESGVPRRGARVAAARRRDGRPIRQGRLTRRRGDYTSRAHRSVAVFPTESRWSRVASNEVLRVGPRRTQYRRIATASACSGMCSLDNATTSPDRRSVISARSSSSPRLPDRPRACG